MSIEVRTAAEPDLPEIVQVLVEAFEGDPAFWRIVGQQENAPELLRGLFTLQIKQHYLPYGAVDVAVSAVDGIVAAALWDKPDMAVSLTRRASKAAGLVKLLGTATPRAMARERRSGAYHPNFPHWYLYAIGTGGNAQGKGAGSALLSHGIERAGDSPIYLESSSPRSASLYERHGFFPLGRIPDDDEFPAELGMWRPGRFDAPGK